MSRDSPALAPRLPNPPLQLMGGSVAALPLPRR